MARINPGNVSITLAAGEGLREPGGKKLCVPSLAAAEIAAPR
jgi:hypothetical protein